MQKHIVSVGTAAPGGIDSVIKGYEENGLFDTSIHTRLVTHRGRSKFEDLGLFVNGIFRLLWLSITNKHLILHCHMSYKGSFWRKLTFVIIAKLFSNSTIVHLHGSEFKQYFSTRGKLTQKLIIWLINNVDAFVTLSDGWKEYVKEISGRDVSVINNYVDVIELESNKNSKDILFLGAFIQRKGIYDLLNACAQMRCEYHLHLCGAGEDDKVESLIKKLNLQDKITVHGWVDKQKKSELLHSCSVMILPAYNEGLPMTLIESMGSQIPVITTPVGAIPEVIRDGYSGYLVEPGDVTQIRDKLEFVLSKPDELKDVTTQALTIYQDNFTSQVILPKWREIYDKC